MVRKTVWVLSISAAATLLVSGLASAKGSKLQFDQQRYAPGDRAVAHALVETWPGSGQPDDAPFTVYLVGGRQPLWFGHLPNSAIPVVKLRIGHQVPDRTQVGDTYRVTVAFDVPRVRNGPYAVWVCAPAQGGKGCWIGFGDLVYGRLIVSRARPGVVTPEPDSAPLAEGQRARPATGASGGSLKGITLALVAVTVAALAALIGMRRRRMTSAKSLDNPQS